MNADITNIKNKLFSLHTAYCNQIKNSMPQVHSRIRICKYGYKDKLLRQGPSLCSYNIIRVDVTVHDLNLLITCPLCHTLTYFTLNEHLHTWLVGSRVSV